jgi:peptidoglycan/LPS O-acetylase OafA/YrhL
LLRPSWEALVPAATWTGNYATLLGLDVRPYGHTWSLGVEEQFYLVWPLALLGLVRFRDRTVRVVAGILFVLVSWRLLLTAAGELRYAYVAFETAGTAILGGCLVSLAQWRLSGRWAVFGVGGILAVAFAVAASPYYWLAWLVVPVLVTAPAVVLVAAAENTRWLEMRWLAFAGVTSYSLYLYHEPVTQLISGRQSPWGVAVGAGVGLVAYFCVEAPLMRWRAGKAAGATLVEDRAVVVAVEAR